MEENKLKNVLLSKSYNQEKNIDFFQENKENFYKMFFMAFDDFLGKNANGVMRYCSKKDAVIYVYLFLDSISYEMGEEFYQDYVAKKIHISKELNNEFVRNGNDYSINVKETNTIKDAFSLLHEYIHKLCTDLELTYVPDSYVCFSELVTRYGELLFTEFLASKKIDLWDLKLFNDGIKRSTFNNLCNFLIEYPMIEAAEDNDNFGRKFYDKNIKLFEKMNISYSSFMIICNNLINSGRVSSLDNYDYILGYLYALFLYQNTNDNMLEYLCNSLKDSRGIDEIIEKLALDEFSIEKINIGAGIYNY